MTVLALISFLLYFHHHHHHHHHHNHYHIINLLVLAEPDLITLAMTFFVSLWLGVEYGTIIGILVDLLMLLYPYGKPGFTVNLNRFFAIMFIHFIFHFVYFHFQQNKLSTWDCIVHSKTMKHNNIFVIGPQCTTGIITWSWRRLLKDWACRLQPPITYSCKNSVSIIREGLPK